MFKLMKQVIYKASVNNNNFNNVIGPTVLHEVIVEELEQWKRVPGVWLLLLEDAVHVNCEQRPESLAVLNHQVAVPLERLLNCHFQLMFFDYFNKFIARLLLKNLPESVMVFRV